MRDKKIHVLHLIKTLNLGGAETNLLNLVNAADRNKFEIHVAYSYGGEIEERFRHSGVRLFKYSEKNHKVKSIASVGIIWRLVRYILKNNIKIVHTHNFSAHLWGSAAAKLSGRKLVEHVHDFRYIDETEFKKRRGANNQYQFAKYLKNVSDIVVVLTKQNCDFLINRKFYSHDRVREIQNGIPMLEDNLEAAGRKSRLRDKLNIPNTARVILTSARIAPEKNIDLIFRIAPSVIREIPDAVFLISGDGPLLEEFKNKCAEKGLEKNIRMVGYAPNMTDLLTISDVYLLPSFLELHSIAILEAMSMKLPIVISRDVGCNDEFVKDWENGVLLDPFRDDGWAESLVKLLKEPELRHRMGEQGYETCLKRFDIQQTAKKIEDMYVELTRK